jgi:glycosyltransferase involved in cell wall biosynthesis
LLIFICLLFSIYKLLLNKINTKSIVIIFTAYQSIFKNIVRKKILIIITKGDIGGAQSSVLGLSKELVKIGCDVTVGYGYGDFLPAELEKAGIKKIKFFWLMRTHDPFVNLFFALELRKFLNKNFFNAVHFNSSNTLIGALGAKISKIAPKTVFTLRGLSVLDENYKKNPMIKALYYLYFRFFLIFIDAPVFVSGQNYEQALEKKLVKSGYVIENGLNPECLNFYKKEEAKQILASNYGISDRFIIGSIGRLDYAKNYEFLIRAFPEVLKIRTDAVCLIFGGGKELEFYKNLVTERGLEQNIIFAGENPDARRFIKGFDIFVLPSRYEGLSITLLEVIFAGIPALVSRVGGNSEIFNNSTHQLFRLDDEEDFLFKLRKIIKDENLKKRLAHQNKSNSESFLIKKTAESYLRLY